MAIINTETAVIGGGPAGLQAALSLGRTHRDAVLVDSGHYRNDPAEHMHNVLGIDGVAPETFRAAGRGNIAAYDTVRILDAEVSTIVDQTASEGEPTCFELDLSGGDYLHCRSVVLATGGRDVLPEIDGLADLWGREAAACPYCHAHEFAGARVAVLGASVAAHFSTLLAPIAAEVVVFTAGQQSPPMPSDVPVITGAVRSVTRFNGGVRIVLNDGSQQLVDGLFCRPQQVAAAPFADQLQLELNESGAVRIDIRGRTTRRGVYAAGDMAHHPELPMPMPAVAAAVAAGLSAAATATADLLFGALG